MLALPMHKRIRISLPTGKFRYMKMEGKKRVTEEENERETSTLFFYVNFGAARRRVCREIRRKAEAAEKMSARAFLSSAALSVLSGKCVENR